MQPPVVVIMGVMVLMGGCCLSVSVAEDSDLPTPRFLAKRQANNKNNNNNNNNNIPLGEHIQEFGLDLVSEMQIGGNLVMSPASVAFLLSSLLLGTSQWSISNQQLHEVLYLPLDINEALIHNSFKNLLDSLTSKNSKVTLNIANALFLSVNESILTDYSKTAKRNYDMQVTQIDFNDFSAKNIINDWVSAHTNGMIPNLLKQPLSRATRFFAVNTVFFNGTWETPFDPSVTKLEDFNTGNDIVQVPMMKTMLPLWYVDIPEMNAHMAAIPYEGGQFAMFILTRKGDVSSDPLDLQNLENQLFSTLLNSYIANMTQLPMTVWLPRMRLSNSTNLRDTLINLGVPAIFSPTDARFHRLIVKEEVWVDQVVHETIVEVTETGTIAAAATGAGLNRIGGGGLTFKVNHPAIIFIRAMNSGIPLFWARVQNPEPLV